MYRKKMSAQVCWVVFLVGIHFLSCTHTRDNPYDPAGTVWAPPQLEVATTPETYTDSINRTIVYINDTVRIYAHATDNDAAVRYVWAINDTLYDDTTREGVIPLVFDTKGSRVVHVKAVDADTISSLPDSVVLFVKRGIPVVAFTNDNISIDVPEHVRFSVHAEDINGDIVHYIWGADTLDSDEIFTLYDTAGVYRQTVQVIDDDGLVSSCDTCVIYAGRDRPLVGLVDDTTVRVGRDVVLAVETITGDIATYVWTFDGGITYETADSNYDTAFTEGIHMVSVYGVDENGHRSNSDTAVIYARHSPGLAPVVDAGDDKVAKVNDSVVLRVAGYDNEAVVAYVWQLGGECDTTTVDSISMTFDTRGLYTIYVRAIDIHDEVSPRDSLRVRIVEREPQVPVLVAGADERTNINDSVFVKAEVHGPVDKIVWARNGRYYMDTTVHESIRVAFPDSGLKRVLVKALDARQRSSLPDSLCVYVTYEKPYVVAMDDVHVRVQDSVTITAAGIDNQSIVQYRWATHGTVFDRTTSGPMVRCAWAVPGQKRVLVKAVDNDGLISDIDTCVVTVQ